MSGQLQVCPALMHSNGGPRSVVIGIRTCPHGCGGVTLTLKPSSTREVASLDCTNPAGIGEAKIIRKREMAAEGASVRHNTFKPADGGVSWASAGRRNQISDCIPGFATAHQDGNSLHRRASLLHRGRGGRAREEKDMQTAIALQEALANYMQPLPLLTRLAWPT